MNLLFRVRLPPAEALAKAEGLHYARAPVTSKRAPKEVGR
jgi:hypothetical protein